MARDDPSVHFRLPASELEAVNKAIAKSGLGAGTWWRAMALVAIGKSELAKQVRRLEEDEP